MLKMGKYNNINKCTQKIEYSNISKLAKFKTGRVICDVASIGTVNAEKMLQIAKEATRKFYTTTSNQIWLKVIVLLCVSTAQLKKLYEPMTHIK